MNRTIVALAAVCLSYPAMAIAGGQPPASPAPSAVGMGGAGGAGGSANALASANARALSRSASSASVTNNITNPAGGNGAGNGGGSYPNDITVRSPGLAIAPNLFGANPCTVGVSGAVGWLERSLGFGAMWESPDCTRRDWFRMHTGAGNPDAAKETACLNADQRDVYKRIGQPCAMDRTIPVAATAAPPPAILPISPGTAREPLPTRADCDNPRARESQIGRDYMAANCPIPPRW